jgi:hypothetical protein
MFSAGESLNFGKLTSSLTIIIAVLIVLSNLLFVYKYGYRVPFFDQWVDLVHYINFVNGRFTFSELFAQHNEHRIFFPRLIFFADYIVDKGRNRLNLISIIIIQFLHLYILCALLRRTNPTKYALSIGIALAAILMFSLGQYQNFYWGFQVQFVGVGLMASAAFVLFVKAIDRSNAGVSYWRFALGAYAMVAVATFTMSNGILAGIVLILLALVTRASLKLALQSVAVTAFLSTAYFLHFDGQASQPIPTLVENPLKCLLYFTLYLGNIVGSLGVWADILLGTAGLAGTIVGFWRLALRREQDPARMTLMAIVFFIAGTAAVTALGRSVKMESDMSLPSRYFTPAAVFWISQIFYWQSLISQSPRRRLYAPALVVLAAFLSVGAVNAHVIGWSKGKEQARAARYASDALLSNVNDHGAFLGLFADPQWVEDGAQFLRAHRLSVFASRDAHLLGQRIGDAFAVTVTTACLGTIDHIGPETPYVLAPSEVVDGRAWDIAGNRAVDRLLLTNSAGKIIGYASGSGNRAGWRGFLRTDPDDTVAVAYAVLSRKKACRIGEASVPYNYLARVPMTEVGPAIDAPITADAAWTIDGQHADAGPLPLPEPVHGSWSGSDAKTGEMTMGPFVPTTKTLLLPIVTGPSTDGLTIAISDAATGAVLSTVRVPTMTKWQVVELPIGGDKAGRSIILKFSDQGRDWGEWFAVGLVHAPASH